MNLLYDKLYKKLKKEYYINVLVVSETPEDILKYLGGKIPEYAYHNEEELHLLGNVNVVCDNQNDNSFFVEKPYQHIENNISNLHTPMEYELFIIQPKKEFTERYIKALLNQAKKQTLLDLEVVFLLDKSLLKDDLDFSEILSTNGFDFGLEEIDDYVIIYFESKIKKNFTSPKNENVKLNIPKSILYQYDLWGYEIEKIKKWIVHYKTHSELLKKSYEAYLELEFFNNTISPLDNLPTKKYEYISDLNKLRKDYWGKIVNVQHLSNVLPKEAHEKLLKDIEKLKFLDVTVENVNRIFPQILPSQFNLTLVAVYYLNNTLAKANKSENIIFNKDKTEYKIKSKIKIPYVSNLSGLFYNWEVPDFYSTDKVVRETINEINKCFSILSDKENFGDFEKIGGYEFENKLLNFKVTKNNKLHLTIKREDLLEKLNLHLTDKSIVIKYV